MDFKLNICFLLLLLGVLSVQGKNEPHLKAKRQDRCEEHGGYCRFYERTCQEMEMEFCYECPPDFPGEHCCCSYGGDEYGWGK